MEQILETIEFQKQLLSAKNELIKKYENIIRMQDKQITLLKHLIENETIRNK
jgi:hypothetical protein